MGTIEFGEEHFILAEDENVTKWTFNGSTGKRLATEIALRHGLMLSEVQGPSRLRHLVHARRAIAVALIDKGWSYPAIGLLLNRDHSSIYCLVHKREYTEEQKFAAKMRRCT